MNKNNNKWIIIILYLFKMILNIMNKIFLNYQNNNNKNQQNNNLNNNNYWNKTHTQ